MRFSSRFELVELLGSPSLFVKLVLSLAGFFFRFLLGSPILGLLDYRIDLVLAVTTHLDKCLRLDDRKIIERQITLLDKLLGDFLGHAVNLHERFHRSLNLTLKLRCGHDLDVPTAKLASQSNVLSEPTDGLRQVLVVDQCDGSSDHVAQQDLLDLGWLQSVRDQHHRIVTPADNVYPFAGQLACYVFDPIAPHAHTSSYAIDALVGAADGDLAAVARLAADGVDLDDPFGNLRNLLLKQPLDQCPLGSRKDDLHAVS